MIENLLFNGFTASCILFGIITILAKVVLKKNGYYVSILNVDFSDFKNLGSLAKKEKRYGYFYVAFVLLALIPVLFLLLFVLTMLNK